MSKKDYVLIAKEIRHQVELFKLHSVGVSAIEGVAKNLALAFKRDNPRFNYDKFMEACGFETDV